MSDELPSGPEQVSSKDYLRDEVIDRQTKLSVQEFGFDPSLEIPPLPSRVDTNEIRSVYKEASDNGLLTEYFYIPPVKSMLKEPTSPFLKPFWEGRDTENNHSAGFWHRAVYERDENGDIKIHQMYKVTS